MSVRMTVRVPSDIADTRGSRDMANDAAKDTATVPQITRSRLAGGMIIARNIP